MSIKIRCEAKIARTSGGFAPYGERIVHDQIPHDELRETVGRLVNDVINDLRICGFNSADPTVFFILTFRRQQG